METEAIKPPYVARDEERKEIMNSINNKLNRNSSPNRMSLFQRIGNTLGNLISGTGGSKEPMTGVYYQAGSHPRKTLEEK